MPAPACRSRRILLLVGGLVGALALAEVAVRALGLPRKPAFQFLGPVLDRDDVFVEDPLLFWRLHPRTPHFVANELGLRGWLPRGEKRSSNLRIACVGDSCTFGFGVRYEESWGVVLEQLLQTRFPHTRVESILAGLPCYSTLQNRVQYEREIAPLRPDLTVLYCGSWNDFTPAVELTDAQRLARNESRARNPLWGSRLVQLAARVLGEEAPKTAEAERALVERAPHGLRVAKDEYADNLRALIAAARAIGSAVIVVLAPHPAKTERQRPIALEYRDLTRAVAIAAGTPVLDAPALLRDAQPPPADAPYGVWFDDWVHPSIAGHRAIAEGLAALYRPEGGVHGTIEHLAAIEPPEIELFAGEALTIRAAQPLAGMLERVWLGGTWLREWTADDGGARIALGDLCETGELTLRAITTRGVGSGTVRVQPPRIRVTTERSATGVRVRAEGRGPPGWFVGVWLSGLQREQPAPTQWGPFQLEDFGDGPFALERLTLPRLAGKVGADGRWRIESVLSSEQLANLPATFFAQGLLIREDDRRRGIVTAVASARLP
jgi:lysophospholipase L1-like esterase